MASLTDRIKRIFRRRPKQQPKANGTTNGNGKPMGQTPSTPQPGTETAAAQPVKAPQQPILTQNTPQPATETAAAQPMNALQQPIVTRNRATAAPTRSATNIGTLQVRLQNQTSSGTVYAYITGQAIDNGSALFLLQSDARTPYFPASPSSTGAPLAQNVSIPLGAPGNTVTATIPRIAGGRIWFSVGNILQFFLNPGPGLVEPSVFNQADPNINTDFSFCEFTFNQNELFVNISYVDFVSRPIALTLTDTSGATQHVSGMAANGVATVCQGLRNQTAKDGRRWSSLIVQRNGQDLRALSPNSGILLNPDWFQTYWTDYVNQVYARYANNTLTVNTQASFGNVNARVGSLGNINFNNGAALFAKPSARDIFSCSTGPFATGSNALVNTIIPRLSAAFNRSTLLLPNGNTEPNAVQSSQYYTNATTNVSESPLLRRLQLSLTMPTALRAYRTRRKSRWQRLRFPVRRCDARRWRAARGRCKQRLAVGTLGRFWWE